MEQATIQRDEQASNAMKSGTILPAPRAKSGKASAKHAMNSRSPLPSPSPETDRRSARLSQNSSIELPSDDHQSTDADISATLRELTAAACQGRPDPADAAKALDALIVERNGDAAPIRDVVYWRGLLDTVYLYRDSVRESFKRPPANPHQFDIGVVKSVGAMTASIMDRWTIGSKFLGDCMKTDLLDEAERQSQIAKGHDQQARFYRELARSIGDKPVRAALTVKRFNDIGKKVFGSNFGK